MVVSDQGAFGGSEPMRDAFFREEGARRADDGRGSKVFAIRCFRLLYRHHPPYGHPLQRRGLERKGFALLDPGVRASSSGKRAYWESR